MPETLLTQSAVKMYGRPLYGLTLNPALSTGSELGFNKFLKQQVQGTPTCGSENMPGLARIYAFSFEGAFYNLPRPAIFLVHGKGNPIGGQGTFDDKTSSPAVLQDSGIPAREFVFETDVVYWEYDKDDISLRLDSISGTLDDILIEASLTSASRSGFVARSGFAARSGVNGDGDETMRHRLR